MPDERRMHTIREVAQQVAGVEGVEKCFARKTGFQYHVDLHLEVDPEITVRSSHDIAEQVRTRIRRDLNWVADVLVHVEPSPRDQRRNGLPAAGPRRARESRSPPGKSQEQSAVAATTTRRSR